MVCCILPGLVVSHNIGLYLFVFDQQQPCLCWLACIEQLILSNIVVKDLLIKHMSSLACPNLYLRSTNMLLLKNSSGSLQGISWYSHCRILLLYLMMNPNLS